MITAAAILLFTLLCAILSGDREWANVTKPERNDLVFSGRHRDYGAYILRRDYDRRLVIALFIGLGSLGAGVLVMRTFFHGSVIPFAQGPSGIDVILDDVIIPPAPPVAPPTPPAPPSGGGTPIPAIGVVLMIDTAAVDPKDTTSTAPPAPPADTLASGPGGKGPGTVDPPGGGPGGGPGGETGGLPLGTSLEEFPAFPGGEAAMYAWLSDHIRFPEILQEESKGDKVYVEFVIEKDGSISLAKALRGRTREAKQEGERVVLRMPKWSPGRMNGNPVRCRLVLPINFAVGR
jgi:protein TonB